MKYLTAALLLAVGIALLTVPGQVPGLALPGSGGMMDAAGGADGMRMR